MLQDRYGSNARVRWQSGPNRGIGHASNAAIAMGRGLYIGQLDADDRLLPGAVARLVAQLEQNPDLACAYASCQRIDAAGNVIKPEYDWPVFSPEKLALTSIVHHFRMFRRQAFARTDGFRCDLRNAVDYDIFLKLAEVGRIQHVPEILYQRRWHGGNTSLRFEAEQSRNTHVVQRAALVRRGLQAHWDIAVPNPQAPRDVTYQRKPDSQMLLFWPDYSAENPYQPLLYEHLTASGVEVCAASPAAALRAIRAGTLNPARLTFHLHWLNFVFRDITALPEAQAAARKLLEVILCLKTLGVRLVWTVHNLVSHDSAFAGVEIALQSQLTRIVNVVHLHDEGALGAVRGQIAIAPEKLHIARHGNYIGT
ncbi:MAG: glycosyltransferase, partial [Cypionkella sp.]